MQYILSATPLLAALIGISLTSRYDYLLFHSLAEAFSIAIACGIFMIGWNARRLVQNHYVLFVGIAYLYVGGIDFLHTLAYKGMGVFEGYGANLPTQLWIAGRYVEAFSLLLATIFLHRKLPPRPTFVAYGLSAGLLLASIFYWRVFPDCFKEGVGLTPFKIHSEYVICLILLCAIGLLIRNSKDFDRNVLILLVASIATAVAQELAFTTYLSVYGFSNMIGHLLKIVSFYLLYKAIIQTSLVSPWNLLFRGLKQSEAKFRSIFETNVVPIAYCHMDGRVVDANDDYLKLLGFTREELKAGEVRWDVVTPPEWKHVDEAGIEHLRQDGVCPPLEKEYLRRDGTRVRVLLGACRVPGDSGQVVVSAADMTQRNKMEKELRRSRNGLELRVRERTAELELRNKELQDFAFVASHDLQEPLRKVRTFCDMLAARCGVSVDEASRDYLMRMQTTAARMQDLLNSLLAYSRVTAKAEPMMETDLAKCVEAALSNLEILIREKNPCVEVGDLPTVRADRVQMIQLFQNLIGNGMKFQSKGKTPHVKIYGRAGGENEAYEICVEDNGIGFDEKYLDKIFLPFQRLHGTSSDYGGVGMGLAICKKIVELHGGKITARSEPGKGSTFIVTLPSERKMR